MTHGQGPEQGGSGECNACLGNQLISQLQAIARWISSDPADARPSYQHASQRPCSLSALLTPSHLFSFMMLALPAEGQSQRSGVSRFGRRWLLWRWLCWREVEGALHYFTAEWWSSAECSHAVMSDGKSNEVEDANVLTYCNPL